MTSTNRKTAKTTTKRTRSKSAASGITANRKPRKRTRRASDSGKHDIGKADAVTTAGARPTTQAAILDLLRRAEGASIGDLTSATGWQAHSVRAALTGLRKRGHDIQRSVESGASHYRIIEERKAARS